MLNDRCPFPIGTPQLMIYPGAAITLAVFGFNLLGDGLRDVLDSRLYKVDGYNTSPRLGSDKPA